ncbi:MULTISPECIES: AraC family transcriptional regulator [unclassified Agrobacterium]|uniref:helix-turn-helix transcriptional regulator n=1 Tax=unclassified Agrobacterium TaxID=2632611 RepID=UPI00069B5CF7|nr:MULTISPECIES: AraC family transcriptional regulator [unclassified Agrobacterium]KNY31189.1 AraC family transcriptional regulator [Agrobacterium sp. SUL3]MCD4662902.1 AraC family transcriptional regulator [Agrobacterium sp.]
MRGKSLFGVTIELARDRRNSFQGSFQARAIANAVVSEMHASSYRVDRTEADIARIAGDSLCIGLQVRGSGLLYTGRDRVHAVGGGDITINHSDLPYAGIPGGEDHFHFRMLKIPVDYEVMLGQTAYDLFAARYTDNAAFSRPFRALFNALNADHDRLIDPARDVTHITRLAMTARGRLSPAMPEVRAALRTGLCYAAQDIMMRKKSRQNLTPAAVAKELGISLRQLHVVFEGAELSFSRTLSSMRIEEAKRLLLEFPALPITQIAHGCGFDSLATFYRVFAAAYGMAPGDARVMGLPAV